MISITGYTPEELGLPTRFESFRPAQVEAVDFALNSTRRYVPMSLPLGSGKSLIAMGIARASGLRTVIVTATKGLSKQYLDDFGDYGLTLIQGRANYACDHYSHLNCRLGQLEDCPLIGGGCEYEANRDYARQKPVLITNYAYWLHVNQFPPGLGNEERGIEQLILDEAHQAPTELSKFLQTEIRETWLRSAGLNPPSCAHSIEAWRQKAVTRLNQVSDQLSSAVKAAKRGRLTPFPPFPPHFPPIIHDLDALKTALTAISTMMEDSWVLESKPGTRHGTVWVFDNIWPASHNSKLFQSVPKVILMSGTLRPSTMKLLGVDPSHCDYREWPRVFPAANTPIYYIPTVKMNHKIDEAGLDLWVKRIDEIITSRLDRKGIIHTVSYQRQRYLLDHSVHAGVMVANTSEPDSETAAEVVERFKSMPAPAILVSPSFSTGWDFPGRNCEWQIIAKIPYPDIRAAIIKARLARMPSYASQLAMQDLEQACGRATRFYDDRSEVFIVDNAISYLLYRYPNLKSRWFQIIQLPDVPPPGPRCPSITT